MNEREILKEKAEKIWKDALLCKELTACQKEDIFRLTSKLFNYIESENIDIERVKVFMRQISDLYNDFISNKNKEKINNVN